MACHRIFPHQRYCISPCTSKFQIRSSRGYIRILHVFLQSSSIGLLSVTVSRFQLKKPKRSCVTIKKKDPKSYFLTPSDPQTYPWGKFFAPLYSTPHYLQFDKQHDYVCSKWILDPSGLTQGVTSKFRMCSSSPHQ